MQAGRHATPTPLHAHGATCVRACMQVRVPEGLSTLDLDIIKLAAQFVARNGKSFLVGLSSREHTNPQFNFLKPTHSLFSFFTSLADAYSRVMMPDKGLRTALTADANDRCGAGAHARGACDVMPGVPGRAGQATTSGTGRMAF